MSKHPTTKARTAITNVRVFDGMQIGDLTTVVIDGAVIGTDASEANSIDAAGGILLPGFIDCHVHVDTIEHLQMFGKYGVTTVLDMGMRNIDCLWPLQGHAGLTEIRGCGTTATRAGSRHSRMPGRPADSLIANVDDANVYIANRVAEGANYIKIIADVPDGPDQSSINALAAGARQHGLLSIAHAVTYDSAKQAQIAGVDILTHSPMDKALDEEAVATMIRDNRIMVPTLSMMEGTEKGGKRPGSKYIHARESVTAAYRGGVPILVGTDANVAPMVPANPPYGESLHHELELLVEAGLSPLDALRGATVLAAQHFGLKDRGLVEPGKRADLVLLSKNPLDDIKATRSIQRAWIGGIEKHDIYKA